MSVVGKPTEEELLSYMVGQGYPPHIAAGFVANHLQESSLNPSVENSIGAKGMVQWLGPRRRDLESFARAQGRDVNDWRTQVDFQTHELGGKEKRAFQRINQAQTPEEAAALIANHYERPGKREANLPKRIQNAKSVWARFGDSLVSPAYADETPSGPGVMQMPSASPAGEDVDLDAVYQEATGGAPQAAPVQKPAAPEEDVNLDEVYQQAMSQQPQQTAVPREDFSLENVGKAYTSSIGKHLYAAANMIPAVGEALGANDPAVQERVAGYTKFLNENPKSAMVGAPLATLVETAPLMASSALTVPAMLGRSAAMGLYGAATTPGSAKERTAAGATGGLSNMLMAEGPARAMGGLFAPQMANLGPSAKRLQEQGIEPTIGELLGGSANRVEQQVSSLPLVGEGVRAARARPLEQALDKIVKQAEVPSLGVTTGGKTGQEAVEQLQDSFGAALNTKLAGKTIDQAAVDAKGILQSLRDPDLELTPDQINIVERAVLDKLDMAKPKSGPVSPVTGQRAGSNAPFDAPQLNEVKSRILRAGREAQDPAIRRAYNHVAGKIDDAIADSGIDLGELNKSYASLKQLEYITRRGINNEGVMKPSAITKAAEFSDRSAGKRASAAGKALNSKLGYDVEKTLGSTFPDSGSALRYLLIRGAQGLGTAAAGAGGMAAYQGDPSILGIEALALGALLGGTTRAGQRALRGGYRLQPGLAQVARTGGRAISPSLSSIFQSDNEQ